MSKRSILSNLTFLTLTVDDKGQGFRLLKLGDFNRNSKLQMV